MAFNAKDVYLCDASTYACPEAIVWIEGIEVGRGGTKDRCPEFCKQVSAIDSSLLSSGDFVWQSMYDLSVADAQITLLGRVGVVHVSTTTFPFHPGALVQNWIGKKHLHIVW